MNKWLKRGLIGVGALVVLAVAAVGGVIAFNEPARLPPLAAGNSLPGFEKWNMAEIPQPQRVTMRDGAPMTYRFYPGRKEHAVVLVHGSSGTGVSMHKLAQAIQAAGGTVYVLDLRGHGGSGTRNGDTSYKDQLDDDLVDFVKATGLTDTQIHRTLIGFSSGGGFVLRTASGANRTMFDAYLAISPMIAVDSPTTRPGSGGWASVA
ncbi:MAG TPA: alpha/beta fold hydrolase, partial [Reyranellaceae bacterium]|nr:alpha/beta fold hydrolase [Reyranellaceae bacterium]